MFCRVPGSGFSPCAFLLIWFLICVPNIRGLSPSVSGVPSFSYTTNYPLDVDRVACCLARDRRISILIRPSPHLLPFMFRLMNHTLRPWKPLRFASTSRANQFQTVATGENLMTIIKYLHEAPAFLIPNGSRGRKIDTRPREAPTFGRTVGMRNSTTVQRSGPHH